MADEILLAREIAVLRIWNEELINPHGNAGKVIVNCDLIICKVIILIFWPILTILTKTYNEAQSLS